MKQAITLTLFLFFLSATLYAQNGGTVRGKVFEQDTGEPIAFGTVLLEGTTIGTNTDVEGFFTLANVPPGTYSSTR